MYELIVIGGGPGGCAAALRAAQDGLSVAPLGPHQVGGTCLSRGCVPVKVLLHGAGPGCDWSTLVAEVERVVFTLRVGQEKQLRAARVELIPYRAIATGPHTVEVGGAAHEAAHILVAAGSEPALPSIPGPDTPGIITSDGPSSDLRPLDRLAIVGGGVIGVELTCVWAAAGTHVIILEAVPHLLPTLEWELGQSLATQLRQDGMEVFTGAGATGVAPGPAVAFTYRGEAYRLEADAVLVVTGRRPVTGGPFAGSPLPELEREFLRVDGQLRTSIPSFYAIGDAIGGAMLAHRAKAEGCFVVDLLLGRTPFRGAAPIPACVYTSLELAQMGLTVDEARTRGTPCTAGKCMLGGNARTFIEGEKRGFVRLVFHRESRALLEAQLCCYRVIDLISELALAVTLELTAEQLFRPVRPHPTFGEAIPEVMEAAFLLSQPLFPTKRYPLSVDTSFLSTLTPSDPTILAVLSPPLRLRWQKSSLWVT